MAGGLCSTHLLGLQPGDSIAAFIRPNPSFALPRGRRPVLLIGAGTGVEPLAGFIRRNDRHIPMHLYFGGRDPARDFYFGPEIKRWLEELSPDLRRQAIDGIYAVLSASGGMNVSDLFEARNTMSVLKAAGAMDEKTKSAVLEAFRLLGSSMIGGVPAWLERTASTVAQKMPWEQRREEAKAHAEQKPPELAK